ncbi:MAG: ATP-binding protein, partial [Candidatus Binataceae bacterium]
MSAGQTQSRSDVFVGREREMAELRSGLDSAIAGRGRLFLISGEPGIGKSRLAEEVSTEAAQRAMHVLWGRCWEGGGAPVYWPIIQVLRGCAERPDFAQAVEALGGAIGYVAALVPEIMPRVPSHEERTAADRIDSEQARFRLFDAVARLLKSLAASQPLLLVIDDLHDADIAALQMLTFVARALKDTPVLLVGTHREERSSEFRSQMAELAREGHQLRIGGLSLADIAELVSIRTGIGPTEQLIAALHETTEGNPLFLGGVVQMLASEGNLEHQERLTAADLKLPPTVRAAIGSRLSNLSQDANTALRVAAVIGIEFEMAPLQLVVGASAEELLASLDEAVVLGIIQGVAATLAAFRFIHPLFRSVTYDAIGGAERARLHKQIGEALEALYCGDGQSAHLAQIANHFRLAAPWSSADRAITYAIRAAGAARAVFAQTDAANLLRDALSLCEGQPERRADVLERLGEVTCFFVNREEGIGYLERALSLYRELGNEKKVAELNTGLGLAFAPFSSSMNIPRALAHFRQAQSWRENGTDRDLEWLDRGLSIALFEALRIDEAIAASDRAMIASERSSDPEWAPRAAFYAQLLMVKGRHREAVGLLDRISGVAKLTANPEVFRSAMWSAGWYRMLMRDPIEARRLFNVGMENPLLSPQQRAAHFEFLALTELLAGDLSRAKALVAENAVTPAFRSRIAQRAGDWEGAKELALEQLEWSRRAGSRWNEEDTLSHLSVLMRLIGDFEQAAELLQKSLRLYHTTDLFWEMRNRPEAALLAIDTGHPEDATRHLEVCREIMAQGEEWLGLAGLVARAEGMLAAAEGRDATHKFENAIAIFRRYGLRFDEADTLYYWGLAVNLADEYSRANDKFDAAIEIYRRHGAGQRWIDRVEAARHSLAAAQESAEPSVSPPHAAVFRQEGEYWTISYQGTSARLRDRGGMRFIALVLDRPGEPISAVEMFGTHGANAGTGEQATGLRKTFELGDAGEQVDARALEEYRRRIAEL